MAGIRLNTFSAQIFSWLMAISKLSGDQILNILVWNLREWNFKMTAENWWRLQKSYFYLRF